MAGRVLYQFPISHYCEKARWNLDAKGLAYTLRDLVPGAHLLSVPRHAGGRTVPVLRDGDQVVGDSAAIAAHLERAYPERPLLPSGEAERARALELESYFGKYTGRAVRQWMYGQLVKRSGVAASLVFEGYGPRHRAAGKVLAPLMELGMRRSYQLSPAPVEKARGKILEALDRLDREIDGDPDRYLAGGSLSIADISAAALLAPLVAPPGTPWATPLMVASETDTIRELRASISTRPSWAWVLARYACDRHAPR